MLKASLGRIFFSSYTATWEWVKILNFFENFFVCLDIRMTFLSAKGYIPKKDPDTFCRRHFTQGNSLMMLCTVAGATPKVATRDSIL